MNSAYVFRNATVVDGTGSPAGVADVATMDGHIASVGEGLAVGDAIAVDARGCILCPGFIDMHSHADFSLLTQNRSLNLVAQGITLVVTGNCGSSAAPTYGDGPGDARWEGSLPGWMQQVEHLGTGVNVATLIGQGSVRGAVMGSETTRGASEGEIETMRELVAEAMLAGAYGLSTGRDYVPGCYASPGEIRAVGADLGRFEGAFYASHLLDEADGLLEAVQEAVEIARHLGVPAQLAHHKSMIPHNWGQSTQSLAAIDRERARGRRVRLDVYPYTFAAAMTVLDLLPPWFTGDGEQDAVQRMRQRTDFERLAADLYSGYPGWKSSLGDFDWGYTVMRHPGQSTLVGRTVRQIATDLGIDPVEVVRKLVIDSEGQAVCAFAMAEEDVQRILLHPHSSVCTDAPAIDEPSGSKRVIHPRSFGTYPRLLGRYVRDLGLLSVEEAIHKSSGLPARWLGLRDRGVIRRGARADIVLFNPETVSDRATLDDPCRYPDGIHWVLVNGIPVVSEGQTTGWTPGEVVRRRA